MSDEIDRYCEVMHLAYETAAKGAGWETQEASRVAWEQVPAANKATMRIAVLALLEEILTDVSRRLDMVQQRTVAEIGREAGSRMAGLEQAQFVILAIRDEIRG